MNESLIGRFDGKTSPTSFLLWPILSLSLLVSLAAWPAIAQEASSGREMFQSQCAECHGDKGQGVEDAYEDPLHGGRSLVGLTEIIHDTMPEGEAELCTGERPRQLPNSSSKRSTPKKPARGTNRRDRAVPLTVGSTSTPPPTCWAASSAKARRATRTQSPILQRAQLPRRQEPIERVDPQIDFDFGEESPEPGKIGTEEFSIQWQGRPDRRRYGRLRVRPENRERCPAVGQRSSDNR